MVGIRRTGSPIWTMGRMATGSVRRVGAAGGAAADEGQVRDVDGEAAALVEGAHSAIDSRIIRGQLPGPAAAPAVQVAVLVGWQDMELLAPIRPVAMRQDAELL